MSSTVVIGASGIIARGLRRSLRTRTTLWVSRGSVEEGDNVVQVDLSASPLDPASLLFRETPEEIIIGARPISQEYVVNRTFYSNLQALLLKWCESPSLKRVQFLSTTMVYEGDKPVVDELSKRETTPFALYEYFKLETELFMEYAYRSLRGDVDWRVWRLPIAFGDYDQTQDSHQFIYWWIAQYRSGNVWNFQHPEDESFGTSWFLVRDFAEVVANARSKIGQFRIANVASGFVSYRDFHEFMMAQPGVRETGEQKLFRSRFEVSDEAGMPPRDLFEELMRQAPTS